MAAMGGMFYITLLVATLASDGFAQDTWNKREVGGEITRIAKPRREVNGVITRVLLTPEQISERIIEEDEYMNEDHESVEARETEDSLGGPQLELKYTEDFRGLDTGDENSVKER